MPISLPPCIYLHRSLMAISKVLLLIILACSNLIRDDNGIEASQVSQSDRTGYHFQPPKNWINDPNGPMYYKGIYHLFYQYNPKAAIWGNIVWAHSVSRDLISWMPLDIAISPTEPFDINGCWSGSSTILPGNKPAIIYTGDDQKNRQVQNLAYPKNLSDPYLREWIKPSYNPVISPDKGINASFFRDPTTAWFNKGQWNILVGNQNGTKGQALLYKSTDFVKWTKAKSPLFTSPKTRMWECPDFYPVFKNGIEGAETSEMGSHVKHVLKVSMNDHDYYMIGDYISKKDRFVPDTNFSDQSKRIRYDYGNFYASKTFFDKGKNRRILWGWVNESDTQELDIAKGWSGIQAIPRKVWLDKTGEQLLEWPVEELESLRGPEVHMSNLPLVKGGLIEVQGITAEQADVEVIFKLPKLENLETFDPSWVDPQQLCRKRSASVEGSLGPFGLLTLASEKLEEYTAVFFRVFKAQKKHVVLVCSGGERSSLKTELWKPTFGSFVNVDLDDGKLSLRSLIDHSVVESFAARGKTCIISRVYPSLTIEKNAHLYVFNNGTETVTIKKLSAWSMNTPPNELRRLISRIVL